MLTRKHSGLREAKRVADERKQVYDRKPCGKKQNYSKLGVQSPFQIPWDDLQKSGVDKMEDETKENQSRVVVTHETFPMAFQNAKDNETRSDLVPVWVWMTQGGTHLKSGARIFLPSATEVKRQRVRPGHEKSLLTSTPTYKTTAEMATTSTTTPKATMTDSASADSKERSPEPSPIGFITRAGFSYRHGLCKGFGYCSKNDLEKLAVGNQDLSCLTVLVKNINSQWYHKATLVFHYAK